MNKPKLKSDAVFKWYGEFTLGKIAKKNPVYVQFTVLSDFIVGAQIKETMWAKVITMGTDGIKCVVDNVPDFTYSHGLKVDDPIKLEAGQVLKMR